MTLEATIERDQSIVGKETGVASRGRATLPPRWNNDAAEEMLGFVDKAAFIADDLRGLSKLLRGIFEADCKNLSVDEDAALRIVGDCMESMATRLDVNAGHARARRDHLAAGGAQ